MNAMHPIPDEARCLGCGYALRDLTTSRCPECGRAFDPADTRTMRTERSPSVLAEFFLKPPRRLFNGVVLLIALMILGAAAWPGEIVVVLVLGVGVLLTAGAIWAARLILALILGWHYKRDLRKHWRAWLVTPVIVAVMVVLLVLQVPLRLAFLVALPDLNQLVAEVRALPATTQPTTLPGRRLGIWYAGQVDVDSGVLWFVIDGTGLFEREGFAYAGGNEPGDVSGCHPVRRHFWGGWYRCREDF